jgi:hypothetical protein
VFGEIVSVNLEFGSQQDLIRNLPDRIATGHVAHVVLVKEVQEAGGNVYRVLSEYLYGEELKDKEKLLSWIQDWETVKPVLERAKEEMALRVQELTAISQVIQEGGGIDTVIANLREKLESAGKRVSLSMAQAGFIATFVGEKPIEGKASAILDLQVYALAPAVAERAAPPQVLSAIQEYVSTMQALIRVQDRLIYFDVLRDRFDATLQETLAGLGGVSALPPATTQGG